MNGNLPALFRRIVRNRSGAVAIEFGLIGVFFIGLLLGVVQIGMGMQRYNALRSISADVARHVVVEYQNGNAMTADQIAIYGRSTAQNLPYFLPGEGLEVNVTTPLVQRVVGASEFNFAIRAQVDSIGSVFGIDSFYINYSRPIFALNP